MSAIVLSELREYVQVPDPKPEVERHAAAKLGGAIAAGILVGAVAAFLVGGLLGASETATSSVQVGQSITAP
jgi:hypothetical protein